jgi:hypothetical protein
MLESVDAPVGLEVGRGFIEEETRRRVLEILLDKSFLQVLFVDLPVTSELTLLK